MKKVLLYGAGDFGTLVKNMLKFTEYSFAGFISDIVKGEEILGDYQYLLNNFDKKEYGLVLTVGYTDLPNRNKLYENILKSGFSLPNILHGNSRIDDTVKIGKGNIIMASTDIDYNAAISDVSVVWPGAVISHDAQISSNVFLSPNCTVCGYAKIGKNTFLGAGSTIVDRCAVKEDSFIKAGFVFKGH